MIKYIFTLIILFLIFFIYCHINNQTIINNHLDIIQVYDPDIELIVELLENHQPIILQKEICFWKGVNKLLGKQITEIQNTINTMNTTNTINKDDHLDKPIDYTISIKNNLQPFEIPLSYDWNIDIRNIVIDDKTGIFFVKQNNFMQFFGCITGEMRIIIAPNDQSHFIEPFINNVSTINANSILDTEPIQMNFIEVIIREGNIIYIPWGWLYFIYNPNINNSVVIMDCINNSLLSKLSIY